MGNKVIFISPGYPGDMPHFARGLAKVGAAVLGIGDQPAGALAPQVRECLTDYLQVPQLWDEESTVRAVREWPAARGGVARVECLWEPGVMLAAHLREALGVPGMSVEQAFPYRDKEKMKQVLDAAGIRTPRHASASTVAEVRDAAERIGYPLIVKPIAGAGSADTHRVDSPEELEHVIKMTGHVGEVSVEEFIEGEEFTFDTICSKGEILYHNVSYYRPRPLLQRTQEWVSPQTIALRHVDQPDLADGVKMGVEVLRALEFESGFTHMEWFKKPDGEVVFGEIGARVAGAHSTDIMNYACDIDVYEAWAEAICHGRISQRIARHHNAAIIFKRAQGQGQIQRIDGLGRILGSFGDHICSVDLLPIGARRRNWKQTLLSDGWIILRHPDLQTTLHLADRVGSDLQMYAG